MKCGRCNFPRAARLRRGTLSDVGCWRGDIANGGAPALAVIGRSGAIRWLGLGHVQRDTIAGAPEGVVGHGPFSGAIVT
jgi:hypothetical protein